MCETQWRSLTFYLAQSVVERARFAEGDKRLRYHKLGESVRFLGEELLRWLKAHEVTAETK